MLGTGVLVSLFSLALATPTPRTMRVHTRRDSAPVGFALAGAAAPDTTIKLRIALAQSNPAGLEDALYDVSTPSSERYGQYLTRDEAAAFVAPSEETTSAVNAWLTEHDVSATPLTPAGDWIGFTVPVSKANEMFAADYSVYTHAESGQSTIRTLSYSVPTELTEHLKVLYPSTTFPKTQQKLQVVKAPVSVVPQTTQGAENAAVNASCASVITPSCLQQIYGVPSTPATQSSNQLAVAGYDDQWANTADLSRFLATYRPDMSANTSFTLETLDDGTNNQDEADAGVEANLDIQYTVGVATDVPVVFISAGEDNQDGDLGGFLDMTDLLLNQTSPPQVWTTSYGPNEDDVPEDLAYNLCNAYAQLGARGVSILFATGDGGVSGTQSSECTTFVVPFPDGCPYMTNVGSTTGYAPEIGAYFSAGGFSNYWARPSYQADAVDAYLAGLGDTYAGLYNASGRAFPDVATQGINYSVVIDQEFYLVDGTSCSSPMFASVVSLINDELISNGKPVLGFLNPWLYSTAASAFNDITEGDNPGCGTNGFNATVGWDPVTGLGSPDYAKLRIAAGLS
ncbi:peptidase S8/S53 domain-containing protein [Fomitopsis serialis]|uniref:peptidase S8/S53 domain-containing protein n=1 Tax=Fomitopsis serialis TaxID=139415 RepID=UPI002007427F|nr:peptidase S8/S53 domain-containing protein [Neoantrodia serialis]KAH9920683.1 peptidase S8/S53 domain-containing protein [Neoantrodia serialis]